MIEPKSPPKLRNIQMLLTEGCISIVDIFWHVHIEITKLIFISPIRFIDSM